MRSLVPALLLSMPIFAADLPAPVDLPAQPGFPDLLTTRSGKPIKSREDWEKIRKPELRELFQHYMYGKQPAKPAKVSAKVLFTDEKALNGTATLTEYAVDLGLGGTPAHLLVITPNAQAKAPCFLALNFYGNHQVLNHPGISLPKSWVRRNKDGTGGEKAREEDRGRQTENWSIQQTIDRGYAFATFFQSDIVPDDKEKAEDFLRTLRGGTPVERGGADTATIMAWAWGFSRMLDMLETIPKVDATRVATVGHSRNGKTALVAAAFDDRFAMAIPSQAGCGGTAPSRVSPELAAPNAKGRPKAETLAVINKAFPHWFAHNFKAFNEQPEKLPFDQHALIALCAPRPVMCSNAQEDIWANPDGQFELQKAAVPVYKLYAENPLGADARPELDKPLLSRLGYFIRPGVHSMTKPDWDVWRDYADQWLKR